MQNTPLTPKMEILLTIQVFSKEYHPLITLGTKFKEKKRKESKPISESIHK